MPNQISIIPESAPFNEEQRAWLDGFLSGWLGLQAAGAGLESSNGISAATATLPAPEEAADEDEDFPWHDPALPIDERLTLAEGKSRSRQLMAAMAQLDCGTCGYDCRRYAEAIASGEETSLKLCSPGGKETAKALKELVKLELPEGPSTSVNGHAPAHADSNAQSTITQPVAETAVSKWSRQRPFPAKILSVRNLNGDGSAKYTTHVEIALGEEGPQYEPGDALGVFPVNCTDLVAEVIAELGAEATEPVDIGSSVLPLHEALARKTCLTEVTDELLELLASRCTEPAESERAKRLIDDCDEIEGLDVLDVLRQFPSAQLSSADFARSLSPMKPRLYSISSSPRIHPGEVHLTVGRVMWQAGDRIRKGVASTMFSDRLQPGQTVEVFVQPSHGFRLPEDPMRGLIMIGPGTGIAPFRAFLEERRAVAAPGPCWLFFGDQHGETDFLYRDELEDLQRDGVLARLDVAFSRDQEQKIYVQDRMLASGREFWNWLDAGASVYVCGDAKRMARDVDNALRKIIAEAGRRTPEQADEYVKQMIAERRYCRDVY